jgi:hypothetical protein
MTPIDQLIAKLPHAKRVGSGWSACCPAHEDRRASLSIGEGDDGRALVKCHAGCTVESICAAVGLHMSNLMPRSDTLPSARKPESNGKRRTIALYDYRDELSNVLFQAVRYEPKDFRQRRPDGEGGWEWSVKGARVIPYRLPELLAAPELPVVVAEGEKDCDSLARMGVLATCNAGGSGKWTSEHSVFLRGRRVIVLTDNDEAGRNHARQVAQLLQGVAESVRILELPDLPPKGDASDWIAAGGTKAELMRLADATPEWTPEMAQTWQDILAFDEHQLPEFPTQVLPVELRRWVEAESHATQTPADLPGLLALSVCSARLARKVVVEPRDGWGEPTNLFAAVLLEPANRKSAVFADAIRPLRELEKELIEAARPVVARAQTDRRQDEARLKKLEKLAAEKGDTEARHEAADLAERLAAEVKPVLPQLIVDDATAEKLGMMLAEQGGRIASMSPEGGVFDLMASQYSKNGAPQFGVYLMGHSGNNLTTDRVSRKSVFVERPLLTCAYTIQPVVIKGLAEDPAFRGRGLLARFLYAAPRSWIGQRKIAPTPVSVGVRDAYHGLVRRLARCDGEYVLQLAPLALKSFAQWEQEIETMLADGGSFEIMRDWGGKLAGATLRLAAVLHCVERGLTEPISATTIEAAIEIARYLIPHADAVLNMMLAKEDSTGAAAHYLLRWIRRHGKNAFTKSEAQHHGKRRFRRADDIDAALAALIRRGYIRRRPDEKPGKGRPPSPAYETDPAVFAY